MNNNNTYVRFATLIALCLFSLGVCAQTPFFNENFSRGIPTTWTSTDSLGNSAKWAACDTTCLRAYGTQNSAGFYQAIQGVDGTFLPFSTFRNGVAALVAVNRANTNAVLTSGVISCSGKSNVFLRCATGVWSGVTPPDAVAGTPNNNTTCAIRVSRDGRTWKEYRPFNAPRRDIQAAFFDISDIAANQSAVYVQFRRVGPQSNAIWIVDDVSLFESAPLQDVNIAVDMTGQTVSPKGVYIAHDLAGWKANAVKMAPIGGGLYGATVRVPQLTKMRYKFINGDS